MENVDTFELPDNLGQPPKEETPVKKSKGGKNTTPLVEERERLPRINREVTCIFSGEVRTLNPDQYQAYFDYWGSEEKLQRNYISKPEEMKMKENPFRFWWNHHDLAKKLVKDLKRQFDEFWDTQNGDKLQYDVVTTLHDNFIYEPNFEFIVEHKPHKIAITGMKINNIPFVGNLIIKPYETTKVQFNNLPSQ